MAKKTGIIISKRDEEAFNEIINDGRAADKTLEISLDLHNTITARIEASKRDLWDHLIDTHSLDKDKPYRCEYSSQDRRMTILEIKDEENNS